MYVLHLEPPTAGRVVAGRGRAGVRSRRPPARSSCGRAPGWRSLPASRVVRAFPGEELVETGATSQPSLRPGWDQPGSPPGARVAYQRATLGPPPPGRTIGGASSPRRSDIPAVRLRRSSDEPGQIQCGPLPAATGGKGRVARLRGPTRARVQVLERNWVRSAHAGTGPRGRCWSRDRPRPRSRRPRRVRRLGHPAPPGSGRGLPLAGAAHELSAGYRPCQPARQPRRQPHARRPERERPA